MRLKLKHLDTFVDRHGKRRYYVRLNGVRHPLPDPGPGQLPSDEFIAAYRGLTGEDGMVVRKQPIRLPVGLVYAAGFDRFLKIGFTARPIAERLSGLNTSSPIEIVLYGARPGTIRDEEALHIRFARYRLRNEWFELRDELAEWAEEFRKTSSVRPTQTSKGSLTYRRYQPFQQLSEKDGGLGGTSKRSRFQ